MYAEELIELSMLQQLLGGNEWLLVSMIGAIFLVIIARPDSIQARGPFVTAAVFVSLSILIVPMTSLAAWIMESLDMLEDMSFVSVIGFVIEVGPKLCLAIGFYGLIRSLIPRAHRVTMAPARANSPHPLD